jgi:hypothetical protein
MLELFVLETGARVEDANNYFSFITTNIPNQQEAASHHGVPYNSGIVTYESGEYILVKHLEDQLNQHQHSCPRNKAPVD